VETNHIVDLIGERVWAVVTEDNRLLIEVDLDGTVGFSKERNNRKIAYVQDQIWVRAAGGSKILPKLLLTVSVIEKRVCDYCGKKVAANEKDTHPPYMVHNECWAYFLEQHPELKKGDPDDAD